MRINVATGEVKVGSSNDMLISNAIGSCIAVVAYNHEKRIGALAHIMLPDKAPPKEKDQKTKYAVNAIDELIRLLEIDESKILHLSSCIVGAGNVLNKKDDTICACNIQSVTSILLKKQIKIVSKVVGGNLRKSVRFDLNKLEVYFTEGDSDENLLWSWNEQLLSA